MERLRQAEQRMKEAEDKEYARRERGNSPSTVPTAINEPKPAEPPKIVPGAVSGTDSESETEFISKLRAGRQKDVFKWTAENEDKLEEILMKH